MGPPLRLRMMRVDDAAQASTLESVAQGRGWPRTNFVRELTENPVARYIVAEGGDGSIEGFAGMWIQLDEAHVVNVAVEPACRRKGLGRLLVHGLVDLALRYGLTVATLECRESNTAARRLYRAYGFYEVGSRKAYYSDNGEDAVIMTTEELGGEAYQARLAGLAHELAERLPGVIPAVDVAEVADLREWPNTVQPGEG